MIDRALFAAELTRDEGLKLFPYDDATGKILKPGDTIIGNVSIGVGRNLSSEGITRGESAIMLSGNMDDAEKDCQQAFQDWWPSVDDVRQRAICNAVFNLGLPRFLGFVDTIRLASQGKFAAAADALLDSDAARKNPARYGRLASMLRSGVTP